MTHARGNQYTRYDSQTPKDADEATRRLRYAQRPQQKGALYKERIILEQDRAIQLYLSKNAKSDGTISPKTKEAVLLGAYHYLKFTNRPITTTAIHDIIEAKCQTPNDLTIEENLAIFETLPCHKISYHRILKSALLGLFHTNLAPVRMTISIKSTTSHKRKQYQGSLSKTYTWSRTSHGLLSTYPQDSPKTTEIIPA